MEFRQAGNLPILSSFLINKEGYGLINIEEVKVLLMEEDYPYFSDEKLQTMCNIYSDINELCYIACRMKAKVDKIIVGPIEIDSNADMWNNLSDLYYARYLKSSGTSKSSTGMCVGRADGN